MLNEPVALSDCLTLTASAHQVCHLRRQTVEHLQQQIIIIIRILHTCHQTILCRMITCNIILQYCYIVIIYMGRLTKSIVCNYYPKQSLNKATTIITKIMALQGFFTLQIWFLSGANICNCHWWNFQWRYYFWKMCSKFPFHPFEWINKQGIMMIKNKILTQLIKLVFNIHNTIPSPIQNQLQTAACMSHI